MPTPVKPHERTKSGMNWRYRTEVGVKLPTALKTTKSVEGSVQSRRTGWGGVGAPDEGREGHVRQQHRLKERDGHESGLGARLADNC